MDSVSVCNELDGVKLELEKAKNECRIKTELSESLRKANNDQIIRYQEAKLQMEKLAKELSMKVEETAEARGLYEDVKSRLQETELSLKNASLGSQKLRFECEEKVQKLEAQNRKLVSDLDAASSKTNELESQLCAFHEEVSGLKMLLAESERKCLEAEQKVEMKKALRVRDDAITKLEEQSMGIQDRLKWKTEQFDHLKEAHQLLQEQFQLSKQEWASEKAALIQEISSLQISLDTQARMNESLQAELRMCNQALAHEESRRKALEVQLSESKSCFENVLAECNETKSRMENLSMERDEEVASLRNALGMKKAHVKELEYNISHLEQDNKELLQTVKELQEAQIGRKKPNPSLPNLRNKLKDLEQEHSRCSKNLQEREAEWNLKKEEMIGHLTRCECDLKSKTEENNQLKLQLESCQSSLEISGEETSILLMVLKSEFSAAFSTVLNSKPDADAQKEEAEKAPVLIKQEAERKSQLEAQLHLEESRREIELLSKKLESLKTVEEKNIVLVNELDKCKKMLEESSVCQLHLKEQAALVEASAKKEIESLNKKLESLITVEDKNLVLVNELDKCKRMLEESSVCQIHLKEQAVLMEASSQKEIKSLNKKLELLKTVEGKNIVLVNELEKCKKMLEESLVCQLNLKEQAALVEASSKKETESLKKKLESLKSVEEKNLLLANELEKCKKMFEESTVCQYNLKAQAALMESSAKKETDSLKKKLESLKTVDGKNLLLANELGKCKRMLEESSVSQLRLKEHAALMEASAKKEIEALGKKLESLKTVEYKNTLLANELDKCKLEEASISQLRREEYAALTEASAKEMRDAIIDLQREKSVLEQECNRRESLAVERARSEVEKFKQEMEKLRIIVEDKDQCIRDLQGIVSKLEQSLVDAHVSSCTETFEILIMTGPLREALEKTVYLIALEVEEKKILESELEKEATDLYARVAHNDESLLSSQKTVKELEAMLGYKTLEVDCMQDNIGSLERNYKKAEKELELTKQALTEDIRKLSHEREKTVYLIALEVEEKKILVSELEKETTDLNTRVAHNEESLFTSQKTVKELEALLGYKTLEVDCLKENLVSLERNYKKAEKELELTKQAMTEDISKLSHEREGLIGCVERVCEQLGEFCEDDSKLMSMLGNCWKKEQLDSINIDVSLSNITKDLEGDLDRRSPLRELNQ